MLMFDSATTWSRYSISRSTNERNRHLIFEQGGFDELPESIRRQTSWQYLKSGEFKNLRPDYLKALTDRGYIIVEQTAGVFSAET